MFGRLANAALGAFLEAAVQVTGQMSGGLAWTSTAAQSGVQLV